MDKEGDEGRVEDRSGPGDGLRGGAGDDEASRRLRANRALLILAELFSGREVGRPGSGSTPRWEPSGVCSPSTPSLFFCLPPSSEGLSHAPRQKSNICLVDTFCRTPPLAPHQNRAPSEDPRRAHLCLRDHHAGRGDRGVIP